MTNKKALVLAITAISITAVLGSIIPSHAATQQNSPWTADIASLQTILQSQITIITGNIGSLTGNLNNEIASRQSSDAALTSQINNLNNLVVNPPPAPVNKFLFVTGQQQGNIVGSSIDPNNHNAIGVIFVSHSITVPTDIATGQASGKRQHTPILIMMHIDQATPKLYQALVTNENLPTVELDYWKTNNGSPSSMYFVIKLTNARITSMNLTNQNSADNPNSDRNAEYLQVSFTYQKIEWTTTGDGGSKSSDDWTSTG